MTRSQTMALGRARRGAVPAPRPAKPRNPQPRAEPPPEETPYLRAAGLIAHRLRFKDGLRTFRAAGTPDWLLMVGVSGTGLIRHANGAFLATRGDALLYAPGTLHDYGVADAGHWEVLWSHFLPQARWAEWMRWPELAPGLHLARIPPAPLRELIRVMEKLGRRAHAAAAPDGARAAALAINALEEALLLCDAFDPRGGGTRLHPRVRDAMAYMDAHIARPLRLGEIARANGLSVSRLAHLFREQTGMPVQAWLEAQRLGRARQRLSRTTEPVTAIAASLGFPNPFYFSRRFSRAAGISPRDYRARAQGAASRGSARARPVSPRAPR